jgi:RNA polymerase sigma-70 factor (ECF subfamily)
MERDDPYAELIQRCAHRDQRALEELYRKASPRLFGVCLRVVRQEALAEEVLQEAFVKIWNNAGRYATGRGTGMTWMISIARNRAVDLLRSLKARPEEVEPSYEGLEFTDETANPEQHAHISGANAAVMRCLEHLKEDQRRCILLAYHHGYTHDELARAVDAPLGTVKAWIRRGLERLRECLG